MKTKLFTLLLAVAASVGTILASDTQVNGIWYDFDDSNNTASVTYKGSKYDSYTNEYTGSVVIPKTVTYNNKSYRVTSIGYAAFSVCTGLTTVTIPNSVTSIGDAAFVSCSKLTSVTIPSSVTIIGEYAFYSCSNLTSVTIPNSVTSIGNYAFYGCTSLSTVTIPNSVTSIGIYAFCGCTSLSTVTIPNSVISVGYAAFYNCKNLPVIDNLRYADTYLVETVDKTLLTYTIKEDTRWIGDATFADCTGLTSIEIPNSVTSIGNSAFYGCTGLTSVTIGNSVTSIGNSAFYRCTGLTSVTIGNSVTTIGDNAFSDCTGLTSVTIPNSVTSIGGYAFWECSSLTAVKITDITAWCNIKFDDAASNPMRYAKHLYLDGVEITNLIIPNNVSSIGDYAFYGCQKLKSVTIPNSVTRIGRAAFYLCTDLPTVTIPNSVTEIDAKTFRGCVNMNSVKIPDGVTYIGESAFADCGITSVAIPTQVKYVGPGAFARCTSLDTVVWNARKAILDEKVNVEDVFNECFIKTLVIGEEVDSLPYFYHWEAGGATPLSFDSLRTVVWNAKNCKLDKIGMFRGLPHYVRKISFGNKVEYIPSRLFANRGAYISEPVVIPNSVKTIGSEAFDCEIPSLILGSGITEIGEHAFINAHVESLICYAKIPPTLHAKEFYWPYEIYVPAESVNAYKTAEYWSEWEILPIGATNVETDDIYIIPSEYYVDVTWKAVANADSYELVIEWRGNTWRFIFNSNGLLTTSPANYAPARSDAPYGKQSAGFSYTVMGLDSGTKYNITITAKAANGNTLNTEKKSFTTLGIAQGLEDVIVNNAHDNKKFMHDGKLYILHNDHLYTIQGQDVR